MGRPWKVVLVDDNALVIRAVRRVLVWHYKDRLTIELCGSGEEAIGKIDDSVDILITDYNMKVMSGPALIAAARRQRPGIGVLLLTGNPQNIEELAESDPQLATLAKPCANAALIEAVDKIMASLAPPTT